MTRFATDRRILTDLHDLRRLEGMIDQLDQLEQQDAPSLPQALASHIALRLGPGRLSRGNSGCP